MIRQKELIEKYGYLDANGRMALYNTVCVKTPNSQGFFLEADKEKNLILLKNIHENKVIATWSTYVIARKFMTKLDRVVLILTDNKLENNTEYFHFNDAYLLENLIPEKFLEAFEKTNFL